MLVLSRRWDEGLQIGPDIHITVLDIKGQSVSLGISAPEDIRILRDELLGVSDSANISSSEMEPERSIE